MTTTYELYTNENGTPKAVEGKAPAIIERVEALETDVTGLQSALDGKQAKGDYATTAVMNTELAKRAPVSHTHTVSQITDMPKVVFSVNDVTPDVSGNVSVDVGVKTVEGRAPDDNGNISIPFRNVGDEWHSFTGQIPVGGVPYCGQEVTRATYADLWAWVQAQGLVKTESEWQALATSQNGNVPFYSSGDGSTTFRMPKVIGYIKGASSQADAGSYTAEGLPNITGQHGLVSRPDISSPTGACYGYQTSGFAGGDYKFGYNRFDASRSDPIYGNSAHVTPETSVILFGVYAFGEITNVGALDADTLATGLATVETGLATKLNTSTPHIVETWSSGKQFYRKWSDGWIEQGCTVTDENVRAFTFPLPFSSTDYTFVASARLSNTSAADISCAEYLHTRKTTGVQVTCRWNANDNSGVFFSWFACGY